MIIDCKDCEMFQSEHCKDCFVMAVLSKEDQTTLVIEPEEEEAIQNLQESGLAPLIKFRRKAG